MSDIEETDRAQSALRTRLELAAKEKLIEVIVRLAADSEESAARIQRKGLYQGWPGSKRSRTGMYRNAADQRLRRGGRTANYGSEHPSALGVETSWKQVGNKEASGGTQIRCTKGASGTLGSCELLRCSNLEPG
jgi:hypothetical protein